MKSHSPKVLKEVLSGKEAIKLQLIAECIDSEAKDMQDFTGLLNAQTLRNIAAYLREIEQTIYAEPIRNICTRR